MVKEIVTAVVDPEIPVLTLEDLGVLQNISINADGNIEIDIIPTYTGCPAVDTMKIDIVNALHDHGFDNVKVNQVWKPVWSTDMISDSGRRKLLEYGIAPPEKGVTQSGLFGKGKAVSCPHCASFNTELISLFGSTACKSLMKCLDCLEPFEHFKCH